MAACINPLAPSTAVCASVAGSGAMTVDLSDDLNEYQSFIRFDLDDALIDKTVVAVRLELTVGTAPSSNSRSSGEIWQVEPFTLASLDMTAPGMVGSSPVGPSHGPVALGQVVEWNLPPSLVGPDASVHLGVFPLSTNGVDYQDSTTNAPPVLVIDYR